jgi:2-methylcitrate dehydratase PrpD
VGKTEERIAEFVVETTPDEVPARAFAAAARSCLDCIGCMLAGASQPIGQLVAAYVQAETPAGDCTVVGTSLKTSRSMAALANGTLAHALDDDDTSNFAHASVVLLPPALALGESLGVSGRELLTAYLIGLEVGVNLARGAHYAQGARIIHSTTVFGTLAATAVAARLLGLSQPQTVMALGIAGSTPGGVLQNFGTYTKPLHAGLTARNAVMAAQLAGDGWNASDNIIESRAGWAAAYIGAGNYDPAAMVKDLGRDWTATETLRIKRYPCCGSNHLGLDSLLSLIAEHGFSADEVEEVEVAGLPAYSHVLFYPEPTSAYQGKFSIHYTLAPALLDGKIDVDSYQDDKLARPELADTLRKIEVKVMSNWDPAFNSPLPSSTPITVRLKDGRTLSRTTVRQQMYGTAANPLSDDDLAAKFRANARRILSLDQAEAALRTLLGLETCSDVRDALATVALGSAEPVTR